MYDIADNPRRSCMLPHHYRTHLAVVCASYLGFYIAEEGITDNPKGVHNLLKAKEYLDQAIAEATQERLSRCGGDRDVIPSPERTKG